MLFRLNFYISITCKKLEFNGFINNVTKILQMKYKYITHTLKGIFLGGFVVKFSCISR